MSDLATDWEAIPVPKKAGGLAAEWDAIPVGKKEAVKDSTALGTDMQNFMAGAGRAAVDVGRGAKQIIDIPAKWLESKFPGISAWSQAKGMPSAAQSSAETNATVEEERALGAPLRDTKAGLAGEVAGNIATTLLPLGAASKTSKVAESLLNPTTYKAAAAAGALQGALQPVIEDESRGLNAAVGAGVGMAGKAIVGGIGRVAEPVKKVISDAHDKAVNVLTDAGIPLDAAQRSGSTFLNKLRSSFSDNPFTAGRQAELMEKQQSAFNRAVLGTIGETADSATSQVMGKAEKRINGVFKDVLDRNVVTIDDPILSRIGQVQKVALEEEKKPVANIANRIIDAIGDDGTIKGQAAYNIKKDLDRLASSSDSTLAYHARQLRSTLMDAINSSLPEADAAKFATARGQFANMKRIEGVIDKEGSGNISPARLANVMGQKANRQQSVYGKGDQSLVDLAYAGKMLLTDKTPNSGSVARAAMQIGLPLAAGGAQGAYTGDWDKAAATAGGLYAFPKMAQWAMNSPAIANYLSNGMSGQMTPLKNMLLLPETNAAVGGAAQRAAGQSVMMPIRNIYESVGAGNKK